MSLLYYAFNKPFGFLSQFSDEGKRQGLSHLLDLPNDVYPVGRLDGDSEGLLLLTNDGRVNARLLDPLNSHERRYWVQVEGEPEDADMQKFRRPMRITVRKKPYVTRQAEGKAIDPPEIWDREPPIRVRQSVPDSWIELKLTEGKNRQVRKMTAAVGFPTLRLIRVAIEDLELDGLAHGEVREYGQGDFFRLLHIE